MMMRNLLWACWALIPVLGMVYHFGPGQERLKQDQAAGLLADAQQLEADATTLQAEAYASQLVTLEARMTALLSDAPADIVKAEEALAAELAVYAEASDAWKAAADRYAEVEALLTDETRMLEVKWSRARAMVRAGEVWNGIDELQAIVDTPDEDGGSASLRLAAREELAAAHYYGARLLRDEGRPATLWRQASGVARQQYRYLAEHAASEGAAESSQRLQRNLERVLDLEQSAASELVGRPLPRQSPRARRPGDRDPGAGRRPGRRPGDRPGGNGAGGLMEIGSGW